MKAFAAGAVVALLLMGCASSGISARKAARVAAFQNFSSDVQRLIEHGQIAEGMDTNAVFVAWGQPSKVTRSLGNELWVYESGWVQKTPYWAFTPERSGYGRYDSRMVTVAQTYIWGEVRFANGRVVSWHRYPPPE